MAADESIPKTNVSNTKTMKGKNKEEERGKTGKRENRKNGEDAWEIGRTQEKKRKWSRGTSKREKSKIW